MNQEKSYSSLFYFHPYALFVGIMIAPTICEKSGVLKSFYRRTGFEKSKNKKGENYERNRITEGRPR